MGPQTIFNLLAEPLRLVLSGRCFTATLSQSRTQSKIWFKGGKSHHENPRYIGTKFNLLGPLRVTVLSLLQNQLWPVSSSHLNGVKVTGSTQRNSSQPSLTDSSSILSPVTSTAIEQSPCVLLHSFLSLESFKNSGKALGTPSSDSNVNPDPPPKPPTIFPDSSELQNCSPSVITTCLSGSVAGSDDAYDERDFDNRRHNSPLKLLSEHESFSKTLASGLADSVDGTDCCFHLFHDSSYGWTEGGGGAGVSTGSFSGEQVECVDDDVVMCEDILSELMSTWREEKHTPQQRRWRDSQHSYKDSETLPDSESFLEELQCDFDQSPNILTSKVAVSLLQPSSPPPPPPTDAVSPPHQTTTAHSVQNSSLLDSHSNKPSGFRITSLSLQQTPLDRVLQYTPELFSGSISSLSHTSSTATTGHGTVKSGGYDNISPELFSSPRPSIPPAILKLSSGDGKRCTPVAAGDRRLAPKRRLLHPLQLERSVPTSPQTCPHTPLSNSSLLAQTFSPELF